MEIQYRTSKSDRKLIVVGYFITTTFKLVVYVERESKLKSGWMTKIESLGFSGLGLGRSLLTTLTLANGDGEWSGSLQARTVPRTYGGELFWGVNFYSENRVWGAFGGGSVFIAENPFLGGSGPRGGPRIFFLGGRANKFRKKIFIARTRHAGGIVKGGGSGSPP